MHNNKEGKSMGKHEQHNNMDEEWARAMETMRLVRSVGGFSDFAEQHTDCVSALLNEPDHVCCIDERIPHEGAVSIAGSGILIKDDPEALGVLIESLKAKKIKRVYMHENCGAVGLYASGKGISLENANEDALGWAEKLTKILGGNDVFESLPVDIGFHNAQCAYVMLCDASGIREPFPRGFEISSCVSFTEMLGQVKVSIDIALGGHGFGTLFTKEDPFAVVVVTKNDDDLATVKEHPDLRQMIAGYDGRAIVDGFVAQTAQSN